MEINPEIRSILKEYKINESDGLLCLLGIYYKLDVNNSCKPETIRGINLTKIVVKDYKIGGIAGITWNVPLFTGVEFAFDWVEEWNKKFGKINSARMDDYKSVLGRMKEFFLRNPKYRKEDVIKATDMYLATVKNGEYLKSSAKFIVEGQGATKISHLGGWCEKVEAGKSNNNSRGKIYGK